MIWYIIYYSEHNIDEIEFLRS